MYKALVKIYFQTGWQPRLGPYNLRYGALLDRSRQKCKILQIVSCFPVHNTCFHHLGQAISIYLPFKMLVRLQTSKSIKAHKNIAILQSFTDLNKGSRSFFFISYNLTLT